MAAQAAEPEGCATVRGPGEKGNCEFTAGAFLGVSTQLTPPHPPAVDRWEIRTAMGGVNDAAAPVLVPVARFVVLLDRCLLGSGINGAGTASSEAELCNSVV